jgi:cytochrome c2
VRVRSLRWLVVFGCAAIAFGVIGYSVADAQAVEKVADAEVHPAAEESMPPDWDGSGPHPGQADFDQYCRLCHSLSQTMKTGPGFAGLAQRIEQGPAYEGKSVVQRLAEYIMAVDPGEPDKTKDPYFKEVQETVAGPGVQMTLRGGLPADVSQRRLLNLIDYMLRFRDVDFDEKLYWQEYKLGRALVSGEAPFQWGGPACAGCHSVGPDKYMLGANVGPNIGHTYVLMRQLGTDEKNNYTDGLKEILYGESAPRAHYYYKDAEGSFPLTEGELKVVATYFEQAARETGTEETSNYLPILALLFAALGLLLLEPGIVNVLFAKEHGEYIDGPYKEEEHHGHEEPESPESSEQEPGASATGESTDEPRAQEQEVPAAGESTAAPDTGEQESEAPATGQSTDEPRAQEQEAPAEGESAAESESGEQKAESPAEGESTEEPKAQEPESPDTGESTDEAKKEDD